MRLIETSIEEIQKRAAALHADDKQWHLHIWVS
jgi:hypothetical protein